MGARARDAATAVLAPGPVLLGGFVLLALVAEHDFFQNLAIFAPPLLIACGDGGCFY